MKLEEAKDILKKLNNGYSLSDCEVCKNYNELTGMCDKKKCDELIAIETVLQEIEHLQKEKAEYEARWNNIAHELRIFKNECVSKNKIREKIEEITDKYNRIYKFPSPKVEKTPEGQLIYKIRFNTGSEALRIVKVILEELLEEE